MPDSRLPSVSNVSVTQRDPCLRVAIQKDNAHVEKATTALNVVAEIVK